MLRLLNRRKEVTEVAVEPSHKNQQETQEYMEFDLMVLYMCTKFSEINLDKGKFINM